MKLSEEIGVDYLEKLINKGGIMNQMNKKNTIKNINRVILMYILSFDQNAKLIDVLDRSHYEKEHIKGAISLPLKNLYEEAPRFLKPEETIIAYCNNSECAASARAAKILLTLGYKNILVYKAGLEDYKRANLPLEGNLYI